MRQRFYNNGVIDLDAVGDWMGGRGTGFPPSTGPKDIPPDGALFWRTDFRAWYAWDRLAGSWTLVGTAGVGSVTSADFSALELRVSALCAAPAGVSVTSNELSAAVGTVDARATSLAIAVGALSEAISAASVDRAALSNHISAVSDSVAHLSAYVVSQIAELDTYYGQKTFSIETHVDAVSNALSAVEVRVSSASDKISTLTSAHDALSNRVSANSGVGGGGSVTSTELSVAVAGLSGRVDSVWNVSVRLSTGGTSVRGIQSALNTLSSRISANSITAGVGSVTSTEFSALEVRVSALCAAPAGVSVTSTELSAAAATLSGRADSVESHVNTVSAAVAASTFFPTILSINAGTLVGGTTADLSSLGGGSVLLSELAATPGFLLTARFSVVTMTPNAVQIHHTYDGNHASVTLDIYNTSANAWSTLGALTPGGIGATNPVFQTFPLAAGTGPYVSAQVALVRINHQLLGNAAHSFGLDYLALTKTLVDPSLIDHGALAGLADNDHPQYALATDVVTLSNTVSALETRVSGASTQAFVTLSNAVSALDVRVSAVSNVASNALSVGNAASAAAAALSNAVSALEVRVSGVSNVASNALSVANDARSIGNVVSQKLISVSARSTNGTASVRGLQSVIDQLSNRISGTSNTVSVLEVRVSAVSTAASNALSVGTDARSIANAASAAAAAMSLAVSALEVRHSSLSTLVATTQSNTISALEVRVSGASTQAFVTLSNVISALEVRVSALSGAAGMTSATVAAMVQSINDQYSAKSAAGSVRGMQSVLNRIQDRISANSGTGGGLTSDQVSAMIASVASTTYSARSITSTASVKGIQSAFNALSATIWDAMSVGSVAAVNLSARVDSVNTFLGGVSAKSAITGSVKGLQSALNAIQQRVSANSAAAVISVTSTEVSAGDAAVSLRIQSVLSVDISAVSAAVAALSTTVQGMGTSIQLAKVTASNLMSGTGFANISGLSLSLAANVAYQLEGRVVFTLSILTGTAFGFTYPGSNNMVVPSHVTMRCLTSIILAGNPTLISTNAAYGTIQAANMSTVASTNISLLGGASAAAYMLEIAGIIETNSAGPLRLQAKQSAAGGGMRIGEGSFIRVIKLE